MREYWEDFTPLPNFERCVRFEIEGKTGVIIIHNTTLGPALGGFRVKPYPSEAEMISDCARLAQGMSYKNACSGFKLGGGKAAVNAHPEEITPEFLKRYGEIIESLEGKYITAPDFGSTVEMMDTISSTTNLVVCLSEEEGGLGDPSPATARGVFLSLSKAVLFVFQRSKLTGLKILIQGYGKVGESLAKFCAQVGMTVLVSEISPERIAQCPYQLVPPEEIWRQEIDIFSPNAVGGVINQETIPLLPKQLRLICGGANNQLANEKEDSARLMNAHIWWAPDFIVNAGGVAMAYTEWQMRNGKISAEATDSYLTRRLKKIAARVRAIFQLAKGRDLKTLDAVKRLAERIVADHHGLLR